MKTKRVVPFRGEVKQNGDGPVQFTGYASTFGNLDRGGDIVQRGAFRKCLERGDRAVKMLWNHDTFGIPIGKWIEIGEDDYGLKVTGELTPGLKLSEDIGAALKHGTIDAMSIGYSVVSESKGENGERKLDEIELYEISPVNFPMNEAAVIEGVKYCIDQVEDLKAAERFLRESANLPASAACDFVSRIKRIARSESEREIRRESEIKDLKNTVLKGLENFERRLS